MIKETEVKRVTSVFFVHSLLFLFLVVFVQLFETL